MTIKSSTLIPTILCGGAGSRLWPVSREQHPKPLIKLEDGKSLLQKAYLRGASLPNVTDVITVTNREMLFKAEDEYRSINHKIEGSIRSSFILEPFGRNTAPAIASACLLAKEMFGDDALLLVLAADHLISNQASFSSAVTKACELAAKGKLVTFGIEPTGPETGYGYIEANGNDVIRFVEKPTLDKVKEYVKSEKFLWNSGMFCFSVGSMLREMEQHCPEVLNATKSAMQQARKATDDSFSEIEILPEHFETVPDDSIDYAVMEKTSNAAVVACDIGWSDIGSWNALGDLTLPDENNNRIQGDVVTQDSKNCIIKSDKRLIGAVGVEDLIIIDTPDALLVANKSKAQDVKQIYAHLKLQNHDAHKLHSTVHRPWGTYTVIEEGQNYKIKRIEVKPNASLSLQMHHHRSEHWVVVSGVAKVTNGKQELTLNVNESTFIPAEHKHRLENPSAETLVIIEVQTGDYLGEDDIVRFQDEYGRIS